MKRNLALITPTVAEDCEDIDALTTQWYIAEELSAASSPDFEEDIKLEPFRDQATLQQELIMQRLIETNAENLKSVLKKLLVWETACCPKTSQLDGMRADSYTLLAKTAIADIKRLLNT